MKTAYGIRTLTADDPVYAIVRQENVAVFRLREAEVRPGRPGLMGAEQGVRRAYGEVVHGDVRGRRLRGPWSCPRRRVFNVNTGVPAYNPGRGEPEVGRGVRVEERAVDLDGMALRYLAAGEGSPLVLLHGAGDSSLAWSWVLLDLADGYRVYAPTLPGIGDGAKLTDRSSTAYAALVTGFIDALGIERAALIGNSLGGLIGLRLSLSDPARVSALGLVDSTGLGRVINPAFNSVNVPGLGEAAIPWWRTPAGACQRAWGRAAMLFARPANAPQKWLAEQQRLALLPGHLEAHLAALRAHIHPGGQREVLVDRLHRLQVPTLVLWGARDRVLPAYQARQAGARLPRGRLEIIPGCGHLPHIECPGDFVGVVGRFLKENDVSDRPERKERRGRWNV